MAITRPDRARLTRDDVVTAALELTREVGLSGLTMRGLADALAVTPMAAYHWVDSKQALINLVLESVQEEIALTPRSGSWRERLAALAIATRSAVLHYPDVGAALLAAPAGPRARELMAEALNLLRDAGFRGTRLGHAWSTYHSFMLGQVTLASIGARPRAAQSKDDVVRGLASAGSDASFAWGLDFLLGSLEQAASGS